MSQPKPQGRNSKKIAPGPKTQAHPIPSLQPINRLGSHPLTQTSDSDGDLDDGLLTFSGSSKPLKAVNPVTLPLPTSQQSTPRPSTPGIYPQTPQTLAGGKAQPPAARQTEDSAPTQTSTAEVKAGSGPESGGGVSSGVMRRGLRGGPPAMLPGQCSAEVQDLLNRWTGVYEEMDIGALRGTCEDVYNAQATFEDPMFAVAGREATYRQFAALKKITNFIHVEVTCATVEQVPNTILPAARGVRRIRVANTQFYSFPLPWYLRPAKMLLGLGNEFSVTLFVTTILVVGNKITPLGTRVSASPTSVKAAVAAATTSEGVAEGPAFKSPEAAGEPPAGSALEVLYHFDSWNNLPVLWRSLRQISGLVSDVLLSRVFRIN